MNGKERLLAAWYTEPDGCRCTSRINEVVIGIGRQITDGLRSEGVREMNDRKRASSRPFLIHSISR